MHRALLRPLLFARLVAAPRASAQEAPLLSADARVSVLTVKPGDVLYNYFGHTAIRVSDPARRLDVVFNYGTFDWGEGVSGMANFLVTFVHGSLDYTLSDAPTGPMMAFWEDEGRTVVEQELALDPEQVQRVFAFLFENLKPGNRTYRYDFYLDNCTNRSEAALRAALGDDLLPWSPDPDDTTTFRQGIDPYIGHLSWLHFFMDVAMGATAEEVPRGYAPLYLPDRLQAALEEWRVRRPDAPDGAPLVATTERIFDSGRPDLPTPGVDWPRIVAYALLAAAWPLGRRPRFLASLYLFAGVIGAFIAFVWNFTLHHVAPDNLNILWAWPTHLLVAWPLLRDRRPGWLVMYLRVASIGSLLVAFAWSFLPQELPPATLPLTLALAVASWRLSTRPAPE